MPDGTDIDRLVRRADSLGLEGLVFLSDGDEWPFCVGEEDCPVVGERLESNSVCRSVEERCVVARRTGR